MKKISNLLMMALLAIGMGLTSCDEQLDNAVTPYTPGVTPTVEEAIMYGFKVTDLAGVDRTEAVTSLKMSNDDATVATAEVSGGKITIKADDLKEITTAMDFWFEAEIGGKPYIAKVNIDPTTLSPESDKTLEMATLGDVILSDGKFAAPSSTGTKVAKIAYLGNDAETNYNHGLALALEDVSGTKTWCSQTSATCLGTQYDDSNKFNDMAGIANTDALVNHTDHTTHDAASAARGYNSGTHPAGTSVWFLPSAGQWNKMATAASGYANLKTNAGLQENVYYWSSTEVSALYAWTFYSNNGNWTTGNKSGATQVRACLAF